MIALLAALACTRPTSDVDPDDTDVDTDTGEPVEEYPEFLDDCDSLSNEDLDAASGIVAGEDYVGVRLCGDEIDVYRVDVPAHSWVSVQIVIDGDGKGADDLDLWEVENPAAPRPNDLDMIDDSSEPNAVWASATEEDNERLAWFNPTDEAVSHWLLVDGYEGATGDYEVHTRIDDFYEGLDCDEFFEDSSEDGPCNEILQFPQANVDEDGYVVQHWAHYSNLRREVIQLVRWAAAETKKAFPNEPPLALMDMSEQDGSTPGTMENSLRHPEGTHFGGNDIDIAYYQNGIDNLGRSVCPNDGYFCTGEPNKLEARPSAFFIAMLMRSPHLRVIGVDPEIAEDLYEAAEELEDEGLLDGGDTWTMDRFLAYGDGWPFHFHHLHFSWDWEDGWERAAGPDAGCQVDALPTKQRLPQW